MKIAIQDGVFAEALIGLGPSGSEQLCSKCGGKIKSEDVIYVLGEHNFSMDAIEEGFGRVFHICPMCGKEVHEIVREELLRGCK